MAVATADHKTDRQDGKIRAHKMAAVKMFKGVIACHNTAGYLTNGADTANFLFAGVTYEGKDNSAGAAGDKLVRVEKTGDYEMNFGAGNATQSMVGSEVCITDNTSVDLAATTTNDIKCGAISEVVSAAKVRIRIDNYVR